MPDILFHQYDSSPFSEKVRVCFGIKNLAWAAVDQPVIMPKPELVALTGGYRRIPVMQIGADIYCDSQLIVRELERRFPEPTFFPQGDHGLAYANAMWSDRTVFQAAVAIIFGGLRTPLSRTAQLSPDDRLTRPRCRRPFPIWKSRCAPISDCCLTSLQTGAAF